MCVWSVCLRRQIAAGRPHLIHAPTSRNRSAAGPQRYVFDEMAQTAANTFRFLSKQQPISYASSLATRMQKYPPHHFISGNHHHYLITAKTACPHLTPSQSIPFHPFARRTPSVHHTLADSFHFISLTTRYPSGPHLVREYDAELLQSTLDLLTPERMIVTAVAKAYEGSTTRTEEW